MHERYPEEKRRYVRLKTVFPVELHVLSKDAERAQPLLRQGFTRDISEGGMCIEVNDLDEGLTDELRHGKAKLELTINMPFSPNPIHAKARVAWMKLVKSTFPSKYLIGVEYKQIDQAQRLRIIRYAKNLVRLPKLVAALILLLCLTVGFFIYQDQKLRRENRILVSELVEVSEKKADIEERLIEIEEAKLSLEKKLAESNERIGSLTSGLQKAEEERLTLLEEGKELELSLKRQEELELELKELSNKKESLEKELRLASRKRLDLEEKLSQLTAGRATLKEELKEIEERKSGLEERTIAKMHQWLKNHRNRRTGLILSYEGDPTIKDWGFIYDQSLVAQSFLLFGDYELARENLDFFKQRAKRSNGGFANAYDIVTGGVTEHTVHSGPNIWLGIAIAQYTNKTQDRQYLGLAQEIADWAIKLQNRDPEGGIRGGPKVGWFSTEHNMDAYALFTMLYKFTNKRKYALAAERAMRWLKKNTFNVAERRLNRGRGDSTIATDTFAWAIAAIGPERLKKEGMDPDEIMNFAEENCRVTVTYVRPDGKSVKVTGFDFTKARNIARGGIISTEWTGQMVVAFKIMSEYYKRIGNLAKAKFYSHKADFYLNELEKLVITSPSRTGQGEGCLPYATLSNVDTGHGWRTARGNRTGSVSGTTYAIFAKLGYNPLRLD